jgi:hypothetical protein
MWFVILRFLISLNVALTGYFPPMYGSIAFIILITFSFIVFAFMKIFDSWFDQFINLIMHFAILILGIVSLIFETVQLENEGSYKLSMGFICFFMAI